MLHGSSAFVDWLVSPVKFFLGWAAWPFKVASSHI